MPVYEAFVVAVSVVAGAVASLAGFGIGSLLTPALAVSVGTKLAVAAVALPHAAATALRLWLLRGAIDRGVLVRFGIPSALGGLVGAVINAFVSSPILSIVLGVLLIFAGLAGLTGAARRLEFTRRWSTVAGVASGVFGGLVGNQGGIRSASLLRLGLSREQIVATATASALLVDAARVPVYLLAAGRELAAMWPLLLALTAGALLGTVLGAPILRRLPEPIFRRTLSVLLVALGVFLIVSAR